MEQLDMVMQHHSVQSDLHLHKCLHPQYEDDRHSLKE